MSVTKEMNMFGMEITLGCSTKAQTVAENSAETEPCIDCQKEVLSCFQPTEDSQVGGKDNNVLYVDASFASLSLVRQGQRQDEDTSNGMPKILCIMVPPSLLEVIPKALLTRKEVRCSSVHLMKDLPKKVASAMMNQIHPCLATQGSVCGIVSLGRGTDPPTRKLPADFLLYRLQTPNADAYRDILESLNGLGMVSQNELIIKVLPLFSVMVSSSKTEKVSLSASEIPACPVCLHRIDPTRLGLPPIREENICSPMACDGDAGCRNQPYLRKWPSPSDCVACNVVERRWSGQWPGHHEDETKDVFCYCCALQETLWVCLVCGFVGCGRYSCGHAAEHFQETQHPFSLELATLRVWDYAKGEFVHRTDLLECPLVQRHHLWNDMRFRSSMHDSHFRPQQGFETKNGGETQKHFNVDKELMGDMTSQYATTVLDENPKKATMIGEEYEALLQSALEEQAQHYEGEITRLRAALTAEQVDEGAMTESEVLEIETLRADVARLRSEIDHMGRKLLEVQGQEAGHRAASQRLLREQGVAKDLLDKIRQEASKEHEEGKGQVEDLEQQVADLTANLRMRHQFSQDQELSNAQIFGTTSTSSKPTKRGKKLRRLFRNR